MKPPDFLRILLRFGSPSFDFPSTRIVELYLERIFFSLGDSLINPFNTFKQHSQRTMINLSSAQSIIFLRSFRFTLFNDSSLEEYLFTLLIPILHLLTVVTVTVLVTIYIVFIVLIASSHLGRNVCVISPGNIFVRRRSLSGHV